MSDNSQSGGGVRAAVAGAVAIGKIGSDIRDSASGAVDSKDHRNWSRIRTVQGSYQVPAAPLTYGFIMIDEKPEQGRVWEILHMHIAGGIAAAGLVDPFTAVAIPAIAFIAEERYTDSANEPAIFPNIIAKFANLDGTPFYPPSRRGVLVRWPQRVIWVVKGGVAGTLIQVSADVIDHDNLQYLQKLAGG
jgi:hypothetical protein